jgi:hypothetical protein
VGVISGEPSRGPGKLTDVVFLLNWRSGKRRRWDAGCA